MYVLSSYQGLNHSRIVVTYLIRIQHGIGEYLNLPVRNNFLKRIRYTETQTNLTLSEREKNIRGAFAAKHKNKIGNKTFLLVDDVITTGATIRECARVLIENGATAVNACSAAIAD